ncbi:hypothetical protein BGX27_002866, partial [Mortierella sp. AM989]
MTTSSVAGATSTANVSAARGGNQSHGRIQTQPLSPQDYQGLVASGAQPVRQALHSFIATSCEKPPETKEEARAVLEEMFQIRANGIRQAIEKGQLATAEALKHKVIQRRESVVEGSLKNLNKVNPPRRSMSVPSAGSSAVRFVMPDTSSQPWINLQMTEEPSMDIDNTTAEFQQDISSAETGLFGQQASTFGLSDDDLMSSFTTFTAKLGDSLLAKSPQNVPNSSSFLNNDAQFTGHDRLKRAIPSLSPPNGRSPTITNELPSPSPWMPWTAVGQDVETGPQPQYPNMQQSLGTFQSSQTAASQQNIMTLNMQQVYPGMHSALPASSQQNIINSHTIYPQSSFAQGSGAAIPGDKIQQPYHHQQVDTWNQYMQYLLHQQEMGMQLTGQSAPQQLQQYPQQPQVAIQQPYQQSPDPHWQATMMTMMMNQDSDMRPSGEIDRG